MRINAKLHTVHVVFQFSECKASQQMLQDLEELDQGLCTDLCVPLLTPGQSENSPMRSAGSPSATVRCDLVSSLIKL